MPSNRPIFLCALALLGACGQNAAKTCPPDQQQGCVDPSVTYQTSIAAILDERCKPCHAPGGVEQRLLLTDYAHVSRQQMGIGSQLVTCTMPPEGSPQPTAAERTQILNWLSCGAPE